MTDPATQIENMRERIRESDEISNADREALIEFSDELYLLQTKYSGHRHLKLLSHCTNRAETVGGLADALEDRDAAEEIKAEEQDLRDSILTLIKEDPELLDDIERAQEALTVFENRPDLLEDAERFREALSDG